MDEVRSHEGMSEHDVEQSISMTFTEELLGADPAFYGSDELAEALKKAECRLGPHENLHSLLKPSS